jgi:hypothetical protein
VALSGVELHKYVPFTTIAKRLQIGMNFAGGVAQFVGDVLEESFYPVVTDASGRILRVDGAMPPTVASVPAKDIFITEGAVPLAKVEISVAAILAPGLKVRAGGGINFPGYQHFGVSFSYLFNTR